jgi:nucleoside-diphosphate-sugar epimerase
MSWIYVDDATAATVTGFRTWSSRPAHNVVDDEPVHWRLFLSALAEAIGVPPLREMPRWLFGLAPYASAIMTSTVRVSNATAKTDLVWKPTIPTYRDGIRRDTLTVQRPGAATSGPPDRASDEHPRSRLP